jgi:hypothetical protein
MSNGQLSLNSILISLMASTPLVLTLFVSCLICLKQYARRPRTAQLLGWSSLAYLIWAMVGSRIYLVALQLAGLNFNPSVHGDFVWVLKTIAISFIPATFHAVIWGCALWSVLMVDEN